MEKAEDENDFTAESPLKHDSVFEAVAPGSANSGDLKHKWGAESDHTASEAPPTGLKGD